MFRHNLKTKRVGALTALAFALGSNLALATTHQITQCGQVISDSGTWELANDLVCPNNLVPAVKIQADHVELKFRGHSIRFLVTGPSFPFPFPTKKLKRGTGVLVQDSDHVEIKGGNGASISMAQTGVRVLNSEEVEVKELRLLQNRFGVAYEGANSEDGKVEDSVFQSNVCDLRVAQGAESPDLDDNSPGNLLLCY